LGGESYRDVGLSVGLSMERIRQIVIAVKRRSWRGATLKAFVDAHGREPVWKNGHSHEWSAWIEAHPFVKALP
jgi:hypothetical protein